MITILDTIIAALNKVEVRGLDNVKILGDCIITLRDFRNIIAEELEKKAASETEVVSDD